MIEREREREEREYGKRERWREKGKRGKGRELVFSGAPPRQPKGHRHVRVRSEAGVLPEQGRNQGGQCSYFLLFIHVLL